MLAFRIAVNGEVKCTVGSESVVSAIAGLKGKQTMTGAEPPNLNVGGMTDPSTCVTWFNQRLEIGDKIQIEVVEVPASEITAPIKIRTDSAEIVERERRAYYERLKAEYEPSAT